MPEQDSRIPSQDIGSINKLSATSSLLTSPTKDALLWFPIPKEGQVNFNSRIHIEDIHIADTYVEALDKYLDNALDQFTGYSKQRCDGFVVALSGGLDSAVNAKLLHDYTQKRGKKLKLLIMGQGNPDVTAEEYKGTPAEWIDIQYAKRMCEDLQLPYTYIDIADEYHAASKSYTTSWAKSSQLPRIRANHLYSVAEEHDLIPVGSTNGSELILVAFATGGPAGSIAPLIDLYKSEVYALARDIGVPEYIQKRKPLISELNIDDYSLYGGGDVDSTIVDPIIRRLWFQKQSPEEVARALGHDVEWVRDIDNKRIKGESSRRGHRPFVINRSLKVPDLDPDLKIDRSYFP